MLLVMLREITVTMTNGKHYNAKIIGSDPASDICLLKIDETNLPYVYSRKLR